MIPLLVPDMPTADELLPYLREIDANKWYTNRGKLVERFEGRLRQRLGVNYAITVSSATLGLQLALNALEGPRLPARGGSIAVPSFTFPATVASIVNAGHDPVFCDVDPANGFRLMDDESHSWGSMPVSIFGNKQPSFQGRASRLVTVVDAAAAIGSQPPVGDAAVYSLHATKHLGVGEGGVVAVNNDLVAERIVSLADHGFIGQMVHRKEHVSDRCGTNAKMSEYHAAVGLAQLDREERVLERKQAVWGWYTERLDPLLILSDRLTNTLVFACDGVSAFEIEEGLKTQRIESRRWHHPPLHEHPAFMRWQDSDIHGEYKNTRWLSNHCIGLPYHTSLTEEDVDRVCAVVLRVVEGNACFLSAS